MINSLKNTFNKIKNKMLEFFKKISGAKKRGVVFFAVKYLFIAFLLGCIFVIFLFFNYTYDLPRPEKFTETPFIQSTKIYDRTGKILLYDIYGEEKREFVAFDKISDNLKRAVLASEDARFYEHGGIDIEGIFRAILVDLKLQSTNQGGSTITQQLIRSTYLTNQKTLARKIREAVLSIELERRYSKDQIFEWYLNQIPFGENTYGVESASQTYFSKSSSDVSLAEAATLTALLPAPSYYSPYGTHKNELLQKKNYVLERMQKLGYITSEQLESAKNEKIVFADDIKHIKAPHFVMYVKKYLEEKYGEEYLKEKGLKVYTTLDWDLQNYAEQTLADADGSLRAKDAHNAAMVVLDPKTGEILSLIGSKSYFVKPYPEGCDEEPAGSCLFDPKFDVATMGLRQPGSAFKPFVYATAFKEGYTPDTVLWDVKTEFNPNCPADATGIVDNYGLMCYNPQDFDGAARGPVTLRRALAGSLNIPAVKLLYLAGLKNSLETARDFGITTLNEPNRYGLSLVLGGGEVTLLEMASAYGVFATEGKKIPPVSILKIEDSSGNIIEQNKKEATKVLDTQVARKINGILSDNNARAPIFGFYNPLYFEASHVAAKTGTTQNYNDGWTMGYTPFAVVGVWVGNSDNSPTRDIGVGLAAPIWRKVMEKLLASHSAENFTQPDLPVQNSSVNPALLGKLDSTDTHTILYYVDKNNPTGPAPQNPASDPLYSLWQEGIDKWLGKYISPSPVLTPIN